MLGLGGLNGSGRGTIGQNPGDMGDHLPALALGVSRATHVGMGDYRACAAKETGEIWCWGGSATTLTPSLAGGVPAGRSVTAMTGDDKGGVLVLLDDGSVLGSPPSTLRLKGHKAIAIGGTLGLACAVLDDGTPTCTSALLPNDIAASRDLVAISVWAPSGDIMTISADGRARGGQILCGVPGAQDPPWCYPSGGTVPLGQHAVALTNGGQHFGCVLLLDGGVECWGLPGSPWLGSDLSFAPSGVIDGLHEVDLGTHIVGGAR